MVYLELTPDGVDDGARGALLAASPRLASPATACDHEIPSLDDACGYLYSRYTVAREVDILPQGLAIRKGTFRDRVDAARIDPKKTVSGGLLHGKDAVPGHV